jgi:hypothetical protein
VENKTRIILYADYTEPFWPLWKQLPVGRQLLSEDDLPLSADLKIRIKAWLNAYDSTYVEPSWPTWQPPVGVSEQEEEELWLQEASAIRASMAVELGDEFDVIVEF